MADQKDDDLLANATPIDAIEEAEEIEELVEIEPVGGKAQPSGEGAAEKEREEMTAIELTEDEEGAPTKEIQTFDRHKSWHADWKRQPNKTGTGATHMRTFVTKLRLDAIEHIDEQINEWLEENPELEVKFATSSVGILTGKLKEEAMFVTVWV